MVYAVTEPYDAIVMDRMLPGGIDGLALIETLRQQGNRVPILILSALDGVDDRIRGLRAGGDDYLTKPFAFGELLARLDALLRRSQSQAVETVMTLGDLSVDMLAHRVTRAGKTLARTMLLENVWDYHFDPQTNVIDVHISKLRQKIDAGFPTALLRTVRNAGYMLTDQP
jgi:two-component system OmpR family response regulator